MKFFVCILSVAIFSCANDEQSKTSTADNWIKGNEKENIKTIEKHFRGFDMAMVETGFRYTELYWAGQDQNWDYALYQLDKIRVAIENGIERRPLRAPSSQSFLQNSIPAMKEAINKKDTASFSNGFRIFQSSCRSCHIAEKVPFIQSAIPEIRLSPIKFIKE